MPGTTLEISKLHCQPSRLVEQYTETLVRALIGNALEAGAGCCQSIWGDITEVAVHKHLGHYDPELLQVSTFRQMEGCGK